MESSEVGAVLDATASLVRRARDVVPGYAAGFAPVGSWGISALLVHTHTQLVERRFESRVVGMAFPFGPEEYVLAIDSACTRSDELFTIRHEMAHILSGEVAVAMLLTAEDTFSFSERRADLFAIADLLPTQWVEWVRRGSGGGARPWRQVVLDVVLAFRELTEGWSEPRMWDRARLRVRLYREHGI